MFQCFILTWNHSFSARQLYGRIMVQSHGEISWDVSVRKFIITEWFLTAAVNMNEQMLRSRHRAVSRERCVTPDWPRRTANLHRSAGGTLLSSRIWSSHLRLSTGRTNRKRSKRDVDVTQKGLISRSVAGMGCQFGPNVLGGDTMTENLQNRCWYRPRPTRNYGMQDRSIHCAYFRRHFQSKNRLGAVGDFTSQVPISSCSPVPLDLGLGLPIHSDLQPWHPDSYDTIRYINVRPKAGIGSLIYTARNQKQKIRKRNKTKPI